MAHVGVAAPRTKTGADGAWSLVAKPTHGGAVPNVEGGPQQQRPRNPIERAAGQRLRDAAQCERHEGNDDAERAQPLLGRVERRRQRLDRRARVGELPPQVGDVLVDEPRLHVRSVDPPHLGQEVVARGTARGHVNRKLVPLTLEGPLPPSGAPAGIPPKLWANVGGLAGVVVSFMWNFMAYKKIVFRQVQGANLPGLAEAKPGVGKVEGDSVK